MILHKLIGKTEELYEIMKNTLSYCKVIVEDNSLGLACVLDDAVLLDTDLALGGLQRLQSNEKFNLYKLAALKTSC